MQQLYYVISFSRDGDSDKRYHSDAVPFDCAIRVKERCKERTPGRVYNLVMAGNGNEIGIPAAAAERKHGP